MEGKMLVSDVIERVKDITGDTDGTRWSNSRLIREINSAQSEFCKATGILRDSVSIAVSSNQSHYQVPNCYIITRALYNNIPLDLITTIDLDRTNSPWEDHTGEPTHIVFDKLNRSVVRLYPNPVFDAPEVFDLATANTLDVTYIKYPEKLVSINDELELSELYLDPLVYFVTGNLFRSDLDSINRQFGAEQFQLYSSYVAEIKSQASTHFTSNADAYSTPYRKL